MYIHTYINPQTQAGDHVIIQSYMVLQPYTGRYCEYNQSALLKLCMGDEQNGVVIYNHKKGKYENTYTNPWTCRFMIQICTHIY